MTEKGPQAQAGERPVAAFVLALLAGLWIVTAGSMMARSRIRGQVFTFCVAVMLAL